MCEIRAMIVHIHYKLMISFSFVAWPISYFRFHFHFESESPKQSVNYIPWLRSNPHWSFLLIGSNS